MCLFCPNTINRTEGDMKSPSLTYTGKQENKAKF